MISDQDRLGLELRVLCDACGLSAGIGRTRSDGVPQPPQVAWRWWVSGGGGGVSGFAPSLEAARLDLRAGLRSLGVTP